MKIIVEIEYPNLTVDKFREIYIDHESHADVPEGYVSIDEMDLRPDPKDDSFRLFKLVDIKE